MSFRICGVKRCAFGAFGKALKNYTARDLGEIVSKAALKASSISPENIDHSIFGNVIQSSKDTAYLAGHVGIRKDLQSILPAVTLNGLCYSGFEAIVHGAQQILAGDSEIVLVGGTESMSQAFNAENASFKLFYVDVCNGAAAVIVADESVEKDHLTPLVRILGWQSIGCDPTIMGIGPVEAIRKLCKKAGIELNEGDLIEVDEAFAPQVLSVQRGLKYAWDRVNVNNGAISLGHPLAASGAHISARLALDRRNVRYGIGSNVILQQRHYTILTPFVKNFQENKVINFVDWFVFVGLVVAVVGLNAILLTGATFWIHNSLKEQKEEQKEVQKLEKELSKEQQKMALDVYKLLMNFDSLKSEIRDIKYNNNNKDK